jgi:hypothetical protein
MPENTTPATGATPELETPSNAGATPEPEAGATPEPSADKSAGAPKTAEELQAELDSIKAQLSTVNRESAERRKKLAVLEADQQKRKDAELSDAEREKKRADEAEARATAQAEQLRRYSILDATRAAAQKAGVSLNEAALADAYAAGAFRGDRITVRVQRFR